MKSKKTKKIIHKFGLLGPLDPLGSVAFWKQWNGTGLASNGCVPHIHQILKDLSGAWRPSYPAEERKFEFMRKGKSIRIYLEAKEETDLKEFAGFCNLSVSTFCRMLITGCIPKPVPKEEFWEILSRLYSIHDSLENGHIAALKIEELVLDLLSLNLIPERSAVYGDNKHLGD